MRNRAAVFGATDPTGFFYRGRPYTVRREGDRFVLELELPFVSAGEIHLSRYGDDLQNGLLEADYIVVEMARKILGASWMEDYVARANAGGIERVLV